MPTAVGGFLGSFKPVFLGVVFACILNPMTRFFYVFLTGALIPQLVDSIAKFSGNYDGYAASLVKMLEALRNLVDPESLQTLSQNAMSSISHFVREDAGQILNTVANSGKGVISTVVSLIIGFVNALFMLICRMQYVGLVSVIVAVTDLIPNFGPIIGGVIGGFVLLPVNPLHALMFIVFCVYLQFVDAYILKPKLFSDSLGVSGLVILIASIVPGNQFGVLGMLLAIPVAAILSFIYRGCFLPRREKHREQAEAAAEQG